MQFGSCKVEQLLSVLDDFFPSEVSDLIFSFVIYAPVVDFVTEDHYTSIIPTSKGTFLVRYGPKTSYGQWLSPHTKLWQYSNSVLKNIEEKRRVSVWNSFLLVEEYPIIWSIPIGTIREYAISENRVGIVGLTMYFEIELNGIFPGRQTSKSRSRSKRHLRILESNFDIQFVSWTLETGWKLHCKYTEDEGLSWSPVWDAPSVTTDVRETEQENIKCWYGQQWTMEPWFSSIIYWTPLLD